MHSVLGGGQEGLIQIYCNVNEAQLKAIQTGYFGQTLFFKKYKLTNFFFLHKEILVWKAFQEQCFKNT